MPGSSNAITRSSPSSVLTSVDLPTFGRPTIATLIAPVAAARLRRRHRPAPAADTRASASSTRSRTLSPCADEIGSGVAQAELVEFGGDALGREAFGSC